MTERLVMKTIRFAWSSLRLGGIPAKLIRPLIAGLLVSDRVGAGIGAELGAMRATEQIDALEASAVDRSRTWSLRA